uniref:hypothetical protein n=1 Tax=Synarthrophyton patena TaxID=48972 RepID=UPI0021824B6D|nr:hypothetical protein N4M48_pgp048 [Synarthrophyton patena]UVF62973.1 hypothetical protein [Synarthrophyton patena]
MQFLSYQDNLDNSNELLLERPIGWSSACLDSTIDYYLNCNFTDLSEEKEERQALSDN